MEKQDSGKIYLHVCLPPATGKATFQSDVLVGFQLKQPKQNVPLLFFPEVAERGKAWDLRLLYHGLFYLGGGFPSPVSIPSAEVISPDS
jgi:hypothetical protein